MSRRTPFLHALAFVACSLVAGQQPATAPNQGQTTDPQSQPKSDSPAKAGAESKPTDPNVLILKSPQAPVTPQTVPQLLAVDLEKRQKLRDGTGPHWIQLINSQ